LPEKFKEQIRNILVGGVAAEKVVVPVNKGNFGNLDKSLKNGIDANINSIDFDSDSDSDEKNVSFQTQTTFNENDKKEEKYRLNYSPELKTKMEKFLTSLINEHKNNFYIYNNEINRILKIINNDDALKNNIDELLINIAKLNILLNGILIKQINNVIEDNKLYKGLTTLNDFIKIIYNIESNDYKNDYLKDLLIQKFNNSKTKIFDKTKIKKYNYSFDDNNNNFTYKIFAQHDSDYLIIEKKNGENDHTFIGFIHYSPEETTTTTPKEETDDTTKLAIATSVANNSTTTPDTVFRFINKGGKTQKRFPKKRSIVFSRKK
jgi:hypothetical protein